MKKIILFLFFLSIKYIFSIDHILDNNNASLKGVEVQKMHAVDEIHVYNNYKKDIKYLEIKVIF